jgi:hypothetical protein
MLRVGRIWGRDNQEVDPCRGLCDVGRNNKDFFDQSLDEIKLLKYLNAHDREDSHHIVQARPQCDVPQRPTGSKRMHAALCRRATCCNAQHPRNAAYPRALGHAFALPAACSMLHAASCPVGALRRSMLSVFRGTRAMRRG